ncbi:MAG: SpoIIE family protein phosphatase [Bdellovibrionales bacterium]|nr:SpoIIE family protein phosphatase [Bdellovibrionales bacterium]
MKPETRNQEVSISILCRDTQVESTWNSELKTLLRSLTGQMVSRVFPVRESVSELIFIDSGKTNWKGWARDLDREGKSLVLVLEESEVLPDPDSIALVDDLILSPFRPAGFLSILRHHHQRRYAHELFLETQATLQDLDSAKGVLESILQLKTPKRFTGLKGIEVMSRHLAGLKPGGDYFDLFESDKKDHVNFLLMDSSSYGISAALLGMILSSSAKIASSTQIPSSHWVKAIFEEIRLTLGEEGHFSVFLGRLNRKDFSLHYQMYGSIEAFVVDRDGVSSRLAKHGLPISNRSRPVTEEESVVHLQPKDRLVLLSDGFVSGAGGEHRLARLFADQMNQNPFALVNELAFQIKSKLSPGETFPGEDCTAIVIDIQNRVLRLAPTG